MQPNPTQQFSSPSAGDICKPLDVVGHLLLVRPVEFLPDFQTSLGVRDAIRIDIADLSANDQSGQWGAVYRDALWFGRVLVAGLRRQIGDLVLARMATGVAKPGQNPPFNLVDMVPDAQAVAAGQQWIAQHPEFLNGHAISSPAQTPVPAPVVAAAPAPYPPTPQQQQYTPGPVPAYGPAQTPISGPVPPAPVPAPYVEQYPGQHVQAQAMNAAAIQSAQPGFGTYGPSDAVRQSSPSAAPVPPVGAVPHASTQVPGAPVPAVDPTMSAEQVFAQLSAEQQAALRAIGFPRT